LTVSVFGGCQAPGLRPHAETPYIICVVVTRQDWRFYCQ